MSFISVHDTHRLPYNNAVITAKTKQSGNTTPLKFYNGLDEEIGFQVYTNAKGYLCDRDGTLYTNSVYVKEDAYVTATLGDGSSTNWIVRGESDITVNDGKLLGAVEDDRTKWITGREYVLYEGHYHLVLHSANTDKNNTLELQDLDNVPAFNEWKEVEQVEALNINSLTVLVEEYTKTLVLQWGSGVKPSAHNAVNVTIGMKVIGGRHRYAQHCLVFNQTGMNITLVDQSGGYTIGTIPVDGTMNIGLFFLIDRTIGNWLPDEFNQDWNTNDASNDGGYVKVTGAPSGGYYTVTLNDRTPPVLLVRAENLTLQNAPVPGEIPIKFVGNLTKGRKIKIWFQNLDTGSGATLPATFYFSEGLAVCTLYPATLCDIEVPPNAFSESNGPVLLQNSDAPGKKTVNFEIGAGSKRTVPMGCDLVNIENVTGGTAVMRFETHDSHTVRFNVHNGSGVPLWIELQNDSDSNTQLWAVCPPNDYCNFTVRNNFGLLEAVSATECYPTKVAAAGGTANWDATYDVRGLATTLVVNFGAINHKFGASYGDHNGYSSWLLVDAPALKTIPGAKISVKVLGFISTADEDHPEIYLGTYSGSHTLLSLEYRWVGGDMYYTYPITYDYAVTRANGVTTTLTNLDYK